MIAMNFFKMSTKILGITNLCVSGILMVFFFAGFIAVAVLADSNWYCYTYVVYPYNQTVQLNGACDVTKAAAGLGALAWVVWTALFVLSLFSALKKDDSPSRGAVAPDSETGAYVNTEAGSKQEEITQPESAVMEQKEAL